jgi:hypothetical protein
MKLKKGTCFLGRKKINKEAENKMIDYSLFCGAGDQKKYS